MAQKMLSNLVTVKQLPAQYHSNKMSRFEVDLRSDVILSGLRMGDIAATVTGGNNVAFPLNTGCASMIKEIHFLLNNVEVASNTDVYRYASIAYAQGKNDQQKGVLARTALTAMGMEVIDTELTNEWSRTGLQMGLWDQKNRATVTSEHTGLIYLSDFLPVLKSTPTLHGAKLTVIVTWKDLTTTNLLRYSSRPTGYTIDQPTMYYDLVVDKLASDKILETPMAFDYLNIEVDRQVLQKPANDTQILTTNYPLRTFNDKYVKDLVMAIVPDTNSKVQSGGLCLAVAQAERNESYNFIINGELLLPPDGINSRNKEQYASAAGYLFSRGKFHNEYQRDGADYYLDDWLPHQVGQQSYIAVGVEDVVRSLEATVAYQASGTEDQERYVQSDLVIYGKVKRSLQVGMDGVVVTAY